MNARLPAVLLCGLMPFACAQDPGAAATPQEPAAADGAALLKQMLDQFQKEGITYDKATQTVSVTATVNQPPDPIEYLLIHKRGKRHEAVFWTASKPSVLNAALLLLGLEPGTNATYTEKDPPPTMEEIEAGADPLVITPPKGRNFWMTVRWQVPTEQAVVAPGEAQPTKAVEYCVEDLLLDLTTQEPVEDCSWVYLGGRMAQLYKGEPEIYMADAEGNLVSTCYMSPDNHLATMVHERARDDQNWWTTNKLPEPGTEVQFVFHKMEPVLHQEREKRIAALKKARAEAAAKEGGGEQKK
ncbi:MAG: hypothetical protein H6835_08230 [Planctomycetes bacterium]|nr:hypothetical protein [Planctomycetota bacterium]